MKQFTTITCIIILLASAVTAQGQQSSDYEEIDSGEVSTPEPEASEEFVSSDVSESAEYSVTDMLSRQSNLAKFTRIAETADLSGIVDSDNGITIFAPSDDALDEAELPSDAQSFLESCIVTGKYEMHDLLAVSELISLNGLITKVETDVSGNILVNGMSATEEIVADNDLVALYILNPTEN